jgi:hypothetical protein
LQAGDPSSSQQDSWELTYEHPRPDARFVFCAEFGAISGRGGLVCICNRDQGTGEIFATYIVRACHDAASHFAVPASPNFNHSGWLSWPPSYTIAGGRESRLFPNLVERDSFAMTVLRTAICTVQFKNVNS